MSDDRVIQLLEEIRDLNKAYMVKYDQAVNNQNESIKMQRSAMRRGTIALAILAAFLLILALPSLLRMIH